MAIWNRNKNKLNEGQKLQEASKLSQMDLIRLMGQPYYQFAAQVTSIRQNNNLTSVVKEAMLKDPIISRIINMWISDTLSRDIISDKIFDVVITNNHSKKEEKEINKIIDDAKSAIDYLLENSNIEDSLDKILYRIIVDGITSVKLGFVDLYEDTKIKLFESNKRKANKLLETETFTDENKRNALLEATTYDDYVNDTMSYDMKTRIRSTRAIGRYYLEVLPQKIVPLKHKGITVLYLDLNNSLKVLNPRNITTFVNTRGGNKILSIKENPDDIESTVYDLPMGMSFIDQAVTPWSMYNTVQDCTLLAMLTRSAIYRLFQVEVQALDTKETETLLQEFKKRITSRETIDVRAEHYSSAQTQIPLGDSLIVPTRNGIGNVSVESIGGDLDVRTEEPLNFFREELLASLGVSKDLLYGSEGGALVNTSATRSDIRYLRTIQQFTSILSLGLEDIFKDYLVMIGTDLSDITVKVIFKQLNSEEALQKMEYEQTKQDSLNKVIESLGNLGIEFSDGRYTNLRDELIKRYLDDTILDLIHQDEKNQPQEPQFTPEEEGGEDEGGDINISAPTSNFDFGEDNEIPSDEEMNPEDTELPELPDIEDVEGEPSVEPNTPSNDNQVPYSVG